MRKFNESKGNNQKWVRLTKIVVPTEYDKKELLKAFEYIHDIRTINSDYLAVNLLMHVYMNPELIVVEKEK